MSQNLSGLAAVFAAVNEIPEHARRPGALPANSSRSNAWAAAVENMNKKFDQANPKLAAAPGASADTKKLRGWARAVSAVNRGIPGN